MAKKHRILLPVLALLLIGACSRNEEIEQPTSPSGGVEVAILCDNTKEPQVYSLPDGTRTWIDDNDWASTRWDKNDKIALWATADGSNYTLNAQHFSLAYFTPSYSTAVFSSTVADMPAGTYTYTAVSPVPESVSGTQVSYQIPAKQTGRYEGKWDILAADPLTADDQRGKDGAAHAARLAQRGATGPVEAWIVLNVGEDSRPVGAQQRQDGAIFDAQAAGRRRRFVAVPLGGDADDLRRLVRRPRPVEVGELQHVGGAP